MKYIELKCNITPYSAEIAEILMAELSNLQFESFVENDTELLAYIREDNWNEKLLSSLYIVDNCYCKIKFSHVVVEQQNWNKVWEKNYFKPILIDNQCVIKSKFHTDYPKAKYTINIDPEMAFGTGHHETTNLMIEEILNLNLKGKSVLDMGCGTGILAILSAMKSADYVRAVDFDIWSYNSTVANIKLNKTEQINVIHGDVKALDNKKFDVIFANINKNVLLADIPAYSKRLNEDALLLLSGFYEKDFEDINKIAISNNLKLVKSKLKNNWEILIYRFELN